MTAEPDWAERRLHFVGIGGCGMSGLALVARSRGATVTGSDRRDAPVLARLREQGIGVVVGHHTGSVPSGSELIYSSAVGPGNPERVRGRELGLPERRRGTLLAELAAERRCIAVAGTHGKTTTAAMIVHALRGGGVQTAYIIGADLLDTGRSADWGTAEWVVVETDESDRSLLELRPEVAVLTNVELEHVNAYRSRAELDDVFRAFLAQAGETVLWDRPEVRSLGSSTAHTFDAPAPALQPGGSRFSWRGREVALRVPGAHNARNAAAALEASALAGADPDLAAAALAGFTGTARRLQRLGATPSGATVYDDYAHHPTEVRCTLEAARTVAPETLIAVLEPHSYARVGMMAAAFGAALAVADVAVVLDVVQAGSEDGPPVPASLIADAARAAGCATVVEAPDLEAAELCLEMLLRRGDVCVTMGFVKIERLAQRLTAGHVA